MMSDETKILDPTGQPEAPAGFDREMPLAVKALVTFVMGADEAVLGDIAGESGLHVKELRLFMRLNASEGILATYGERVRAGLLRWMDANKVVLPSCMRPLADTVRGQSDSQDRGTPFFLDAERIGEALPSLPGGPHFVETYSGLWRVFRLGSEGGLTVSRAFLNIRPQHILNDTDRPAPYFSMMFREGRNRPRLDLISQPGKTRHVLPPFGKATGLVFPLGDRITFIGTRLSGVNPNPLTMIWMADESELSAPGGRADLAYGLAIMPNAIGEQVASYTFAVRIDEPSDDRESYVKARDAELAQLNERYSIEDPGDRDALIAAMGDKQKYQIFVDLTQNAGPLIIA